MDFDHLQMNEDDMMGELSESWGNLIQSKRRRLPDEGPPPKGQGKGNQLTRALIQLAWRHESQLQALAMEDQYILFWQSDQRGILPQLVQATTKWKDLQQKGQTTMALRNHLMQTLTQELLVRFEKVMKAKSGIMDTWSTMCSGSRWRP